MGFLFVEPPNCDCPCISENRDAQVEGSCKLIRTAPFGDNYKDGKQNNWDGLTKILLNAFIDSPVFAHNC